MTDNGEREMAAAPPAGRHAVTVLGVTLVVRQSGDHGFELLLRSGPHVWRPRPLWFRSDRIEPSIVWRDLHNVIVPLLGAIMAPGALTEAEIANAMIGLAFIASTDTSGAVMKADMIPAPPGAPS